MAIEDINLKLNIDESQVKKALPSMKELRKELKAIQDQMASMEEGSDAFLEAANKAGTLQHQISEIREATKGASADFGDCLSNVMKAAAGISGAFQVVQGSLNLLGVESESVTESIKTMQSMMAITQGLASIDEGIKSLAKLRNAITGTTVVAKALRAALTPKAILALTAAITAAVMIFKKFRKEAEEQKKALEAQQKAAKEAADAYNQNYANAIKNVAANYNSLRIQYNKLKTDVDKNKWLDKHKEEIKQLGLNVNSLTDAERIFVTDTDKVLKAFEYRARAAAYQNVAVETYEKYYKKLAQIQKYLVKEGDIAFGETNKYDGNLIEGDDKKLRYTKAGAAAKNNQIKEDAGLNQMLKVADSWSEGAVKLTEMEQRILGTGQEVVENSTTKTTEASKAIDDTISKLKEKYQLEIDMLNLERDNGNPDAQGQDYYKRMLEIQNEYRNEMSLTGKATAQDFLEIDQAIIKTTLDSQALYDQEEEARKQREQDAFDNSMSGIDTQIAAANAAFAESSQAENDEITRLQTILNLERQRLELMSQAGLEGTQAWYEQKQAVAEYENELKNAQAGNDTLKKTMSNVSKVGTAAMGAIGNVLSNLAATQDQTSREGFETAKKLNIAAATMSMLTGLVEIWAGTFTTKTGPWDYALMAIQSAALIATSAININNIKKQTFDSAGSTSTSSSGVSTSAVSASITPPVQYTQDVQGAELMGQIADQKVYVSEVDLQRVNKKVTVQEAENTY